MEDVLIVSIVFQVLLYLYMISYFVLVLWWPKYITWAWSLASFVLFLVIALMDIILTGVA